VLRLREQMKEDFLKAMLHGIGEIQVALASFLSPSTRSPVSGVAFAPFAISPSLPSCCSMACAPVRYSVFNSKISAWRMSTSTSSAKAIKSALCHCRQKPSKSSKAICDGRDL